MFRMRTLTALGLGVSTFTLGVASPVSAAEVVFSTGTRADGTPLARGEAPLGEVTILGGITQLRTADGDVVSIVGDAAFDASGADIAMTRGRFTAIAGQDGQADVTVRGDMTVRVAGQDAVASFNVDPLGILTGRGLGGSVSVTSGGSTQTFDIGQAFRAAIGSAPSAAVTAGAQSVSAPVADTLAAALAGFRDVADAGDLTGLDVGQNPLLANYRSAGAAALLSDAIRLQNSANAFDFLKVSDAYLNVNLASVIAGQPLGSFSPDFAATTLANYIQQLRNGIADTIAAGGNPAYQQALLSYFTSDGVPATASASVRSTIADYAAYVAGGGRFGTVPVVVAPTPTPTPAPAPTPTPTPPTTSTPTPALPAGFTRAEYSGSVSLNGNLGTPAPQGAVLNASGQFVGLYSPALGTFNLFNATLKDARSGPGWVIGRYSNGSLNGTFLGDLAYTTDQAFHYGLLTGPLAVSFPTSGTATYGLTAFTTPSFGFNQAYPSSDAVTGAGLFGGLAIAFGSSPRLGIDGTLTLSRLGVAYRYDFTSAGGLTAPSVALFNPASINGGATIYSNDPLCADGAGCEFRVALGRGGTGASLLAGTYGIVRVDRGGAVVATGAAVYTEGGPVTVAPGTRLTATPPPIATPTPTPTPTPVPTPAPTTTATYVGGGFGDAGPITVALDATGKVTRFGGTTLDTVKLIDGRTGSNWLIGRYADGTTLSTFNGVTSTQTYGPNDGLPFAYATAVPTALPTTGVATFGIAAFTTPTFADKSVVTSASLTGGFALAYGSAPKFGAAGILTLTNAGAQRYEFLTPGGLSAPSVAVFASGTSYFPSGFINVTTSDARCAPNCRVSLNMITGGTTSDVFAGTYSIGTLSANGSAFGSILSGAAVATTGTPVGATPTAAATPTPTPTSTYASYDGSIAANVDGGIAGRLTSVVLRGGAVAGTGEAGSEFIYSAPVSNAASGAGWVLGRFVGGTNSGPGSTRTIPAGTAEHFAFSTTRPTSIPTSGIATFGLASFTPPTLATGAAVTNAQMYGGVAIQFGTTPLFGVTGALTFDTGGASRRYDWQSSGGLAAPSLATNRPNGLFAMDAGVAVTTNDPACGTSCRFLTGFVLGGANATVVAGGWKIGTQAGTNFVAGAAVYLAGSPVTTAPSAAAGGTSAPTGTLSYSAQGPAGRVDGYPASVTATADGRVSAVSIGSASFTLGSAVNAEQGGVAGIIGWSRWTGGTASIGGTATALTANQGYHQVYGTPVTNVPTAGTATYGLVGATAPTSDTVNAAPGKFEGTLAVDFATRRVGWESVIAFNGTNYAFNTSGGIAAPSVNLSATNTWVGSANQQNGNANSPIGGRGNGFLSGDGASHAGMTYFINTSVDGTITGSVAFAKKP